MRNWVFLQSNVNVHDRIAAMRGDYDDGSRTMEFLISAGALIVVMGALVYAYRQFARRLSDQARGRGDATPRWASERRSEAEIRADMLAKLAEIAVGASCWLFWDAEGRRRRAKARLTVVKGDQATLDLSGSEIPTGKVRLVAPSRRARGIQFEMQTTATRHPGRTILEAQPGAAAVEIEESARARTGLKAAAALNSDSGSAEAFALRIIDLSQTGLGVLCDRVLRVDDRYRLKVALGDRSEKLAFDARVTWAEEGSGGIHRGGLIIESHDFDQDALVSDFLREEVLRAPRETEGEGPVALDDSAA